MTIQGVTGGFPTAVAPSSSSEAVFSSADPALSVYDGRKLLGEVYEAEAGFIGVTRSGATFGPFRKPADAGAAVSQHVRATGDA